MKKTSDNRSSRGDRQTVTIDTLYISRGRGRNRKINIRIRFGGWVPHVLGEEETRMEAQGQRSREAEIESEIYGGYETQIGTSSKKVLSLSSIRR
jgi:hypothetical protein